MSRRRCCSAVMHPGIARPQSFMVPCGAKVLCAGTVARRKSMASAIVASSIKSFLITGDLHIGKLWLTSGGRYGVCGARTNRPKEVGATCETMEVILVDVGTFTLQTHWPVSSRTGEQYGGVSTSRATWTVSKWLSNTFGPLIPPCLGSRSRGLRGGGSGP